MNGVLSHNSALERLHWAEDNTELEKKMLNQYLHPQCIDRNHLGRIHVGCIEFLHAAAFLGMLPDRKLSAFGTHVSSHPYQLKK